jgi:hypothetical protein
VAAKIEAMAEDRSHLRTIQVIFAIGVMALTMAVYRQEHLARILRDDGGLGAVIIAYPCLALSVFLFIRWLRRKD